MAYNMVQSNGMGMDLIEHIINEIKDFRKEAKEQANESNSRLTAIEQDLKYHIKRTDILEADLKPIKEHHDGVKFSNKLIIKVLTGGVAIATIVTKIMGVW